MYFTAHPLPQKCGRFIRTDNKGHLVSDVGVCVPLHRFIRDYKEELRIRAFVDDNRGSCSIHMK